MEQLASADAPIETTSASESRDDFTIYKSPLVQFPLTTDVFFIRQWKAMSMVLMKKSLALMLLFGGPLWVKPLLSLGLLDLHRGTLL